MRKKAVLIVMLLAAGVLGLVTTLAGPRAQREGRNHKGQILEAHMYPLTAAEWQAEEDGYVDLAERLENEALVTDRNGDLALEPYVALEIVGDDLDMLDHFKEKLDMFKQAGGLTSLQPSEVSHPLFGARINYLEPKPANGVAPNVGFMSQEFYLPFQSGQIWSSRSYAGHQPCGYSMSMDWTRYDGTTAGSLVISPAAGQLYTRRQSSCTNCPYRNDCGTRLSYGYGNYARLVSPDGSVSFLAHLDRFLSGDACVLRGAAIGLVGSTGCSTAPHLHSDRRGPTGSCVTQTFVEGLASPDSRLTSQNK